jgi:hypothetical protein
MQGWKKPRFFNKTQPSGFFLVFFIFAQKKEEFLGFFSVSRILLGASGL